MKDFLQIEPLRVADGRDMSLAPAHVRRIGLMTEEWFAACEKAYRQAVIASLLAYRAEREGRQR